MQSLLRDFQYSLRQLVKRPGFALTAILSLALGIGATVSVFSVIYGVLLHPFPYADVDRIGNLSIRDTTRHPLRCLFHRAAVARAAQGARLRELRHLAAGRPTVTGEEIPGGCLCILRNWRDVPDAGRAGLLGRNLGPSDSPDGQEPQPVVELHYRFWQRHFHGDPAILGKTLELDAQEVHDHRRDAAELHRRLGHGCVSAARRSAHREVQRRDGEAASGRKLGARTRNWHRCCERFAHEHPDNFPRKFKVDIRPLT